MFVLIKNPFFVLGFLIRIVLISLLLPQAEEAWYLPFLDVSTDVFNVNPWRIFLQNNGDIAAFPYGYAMWAVFLPLVLICKKWALSLHCGYALTLFFFDASVLVFLHHLLHRASLKQLLVGYWLSPIVLFATYWLGFNDIVPVAFLLATFLACKKSRLGLCGFLCGTAVSAKLSMMMAIPFFAMYLYLNKSLRRQLFVFVKGLCVSCVVWIVPFVCSSDALRMLLGNSEMKKIYQLSVSFASGVHVYVLPLSYFVLVYFSSTLKRMNFDLLYAMVGISFWLVLVLTPASSGWFVWVMPLLMYYQSLRGRMAFVLNSFFSVVYLLSSLPSSDSPRFLGKRLSVDFKASFVHILGSHGIGLLHTVLCGLGVVIACMIWRDAVLRNDHFRLSRKPFVLGIAGDSGSGKDTLVLLLRGLFGEHSTVLVSGDNYHAWDRHKPMWKVMTHLNPRANRLEQFARDISLLKDGKKIQSSHYDHASGKMSLPLSVSSNDMIVASGLHALSSPSLRACYDLRIFLATHEGLRRFLKIKRDVGERGHSYEHVVASIEKRREDAEKFIQPQEHYADIVLSLEPVHPHVLELKNSYENVRFALSVRWRNGFNPESLMRALIVMCGLHVDMRWERGGEEVVLYVEGDASSEDISVASGMLFSDLHEMLDAQPVWESGMKGIMQLVVLFHIHHTLQRRLA